MTLSSHCRTDARVLAEPVAKALSHPSGRVVFIDALRLLATFQMVQGHTLDAVLATAARHGMAFELWQSARGLTAVAFLFVAGLTFQQTTLRQLEAFRARPGVLRRRALRALRLVGLGYLLHAPLALLWTEDPSARRAVMGDFLAVDVLQCIGVTLLCFAAATRWLGNARVVATASLLVAFAALVASTFTADLSVNGAWAWLTSYVSPQGGSIFPLVPWAAHFALGVAVAHWAGKGADTWTPRLMAAGAVGVAVGLCLREVAASDVMALHVLRVSIVCLVCAVLNFGLQGGGRLPSWAETIAGRTLHIYVFHILLVYGAGAGLAELVGPTLRLPLALMATLAVLGMSAWVGLAFKPLGRHLPLPRGSASRGAP